MFDLNIITHLAHKASQVIPEKLDLFPLLTVMAEDFISCMLLESQWKQGK